MKMPPITDDNMDDDDGEPPEYVEAPLYSGRMFEITISTGDRARSLPFMWHPIVYEDGKLAKVYTIDLQEGMLMQVGGQIASIECIDDGLYHGLLDGDFIGFEPDEDDEIPRQKFTRDIYIDGRIVWTRVIEPSNEPPSIA
jgi:hypothetical protein